MRLAFCVFANHLYVAWDDRSLCVPIHNNRLEPPLFDVLSAVVPSKKWDEIIIPAGPAPFTQLRILRATQLGLSTGLKCAAPMVNMFDVLFSSACLKTGVCFLETRRGDYFYQMRKEGVKDSVSTGVCAADLFPHEDGASVISDDLKLATVSITLNPAQVMLENPLPICTDLFYGIVPKFMENVKTTC